MVVCTLLLPRQLLPRQLGGCGRPRVGTLASLTSFISCIAIETVISNTISTLVDRKIFQVAAQLVPVT